MEVSVVVNGICMAEFYLRATMMLMFYLLAIGISLVLYTIDGRALGNVTKASVSCLGTTLSYSI